MSIDISLDLYKIFCSVVKRGNMSLAAKDLYISQPAVSMSIQQLENRLGSTLLVRTTKGVRPTPEGKVLYEYLVQALNLIETAEKKYHEMVHMETGEIAIGASDTLLSNYLLPYLKEYKSLYSHIKIKVTNKTTLETIRLLKNGSVDIGFVNLPIQDTEGLDITPCLAVHDCFVAGEQFSHLSQGILLEDINQYPLLFLERASTSRRFLDQYAANHQIQLEPYMELGSSELLIEFAKINFGITSAIKEFVQPAIDDGALIEIPVTPPIPERSIGIVKLKNVALSHAAKNFATLFQSAKDTFN